MKKIITSYFFSLISFVSFSQTMNTTNSTESTNVETTIVSEEVVDPLIGKSKIELTQIYLNEVKTLMSTLPYSPFTLGVPSDTTSQVQTVGLDIPMTKYTTKKLDKVSSTTTDFNKTIQNSLFEILPYSDREDIISAIIYVQSINRMIKKIY